MEIYCCSCCFFHIMMHDAPSPITNPNIFLLPSMLYLFLRIDGIFQQITVVFFFSIFFSPYSHWLKWLPTELYFIRQQIHSNSSKIANSFMWKIITWNINHFAFWREKKTGWQRAKKWEKGKIELNSVFRSIKKCRSGDSYVAMKLWNHRV